MFVGCTCALLALLISGTVCQAIPFKGELLSDLGEEPFASHQDDVTFELDPASEFADESAHSCPDNVDSLSKGDEASKGDDKHSRLDEKKSATAKKPPAYKSLRYDEDYSFLREASSQEDYWDHIKFIPLGCEKDHYLSIGGELRERYEFYHNPNFGAGPQDAQGNNDWMLQRYLLHGDLHVNENVRFFGQFISGIESGEIGGPRPDVDRDDFDMHQAFADIQFPIAEQTTWRVGRQEFEYGSGRLISPREVPNLRRSFDAAKAIVKTGDWAIDAFWSRPVRNQGNVFDDDSNPQKSLWGFYGVHPIELLPSGHADLYYLG
jgi:hypothetical protein